MTCSLRRSIARLAALVPLLLAAAPDDAAAWGEPGHRIVCQIALERLTPEGRALVNTIRAQVSSVRDDCEACNGGEDDGRDMSFQAGCIWADESRNDTFKGTREYHFINVSNEFTEFDFDRDCAAMDCVAVAVQRYARYLAIPANGRGARERRVLALRFLV